ncbi:hypothetical protein V7S43_012808 [Phytophthora oleae]|uniref:Uncharacterized protein n=1 Tax=Phytophthora oleae TaxID=2107226 RepID=A0ABD3F697_9STRA
MRQMYGSRVEVGQEAAISIAAVTDRLLLAVCTRVWPPSSSNELRTLPIARLEYDEKRNPAG